MKYLMLLSFIPLKLFSQDITGVWTGTLYNDTTKQSLRYELAISKVNNRLSGYSHTIFVIDGIENIGIKTVSIKRNNDNILITDEKFIYNNCPEPPAKDVRMFSDLVISQKDSFTVLTGTWRTNLDQNV